MKKKDRVELRYYDVPLKEGVLAMLGDGWVRAYGDGIDSNGSLNLSGGSITLRGPTAGDTAVLDYASEGIISGASL